MGIARVGKLARPLFSYQTVDADLQRYGTSLGFISLWLRGRGPFPPALSDPLPAALLGALPGGNIKVIYGWKLVASHMELQPGSRGLQSVAYEPNDSAMAQRRELVKPPV